MKKLLILSIVVVILAVIAQKSRAAIVVQDISVAGFNALATTYETSWSVVYRGGGGVTEELRLARNIATPQVGGGSNTLIGQFTWSTSNDMEISIDMAGNISARANSNTVGTWAITRSFNQVLIMLYDDHVLDAPSVVRQADWDLLSFALPRLTFSRISQAEAVQTNGFGLALCVVR